MADYNHSRSYPPNHLASGGSGSGLFWILFAVAGLGILVLLGSFGGGSTPIEHPGGAGADPVVVQPESTPVPDAGTSVID